MDPAQTILRLAEIIARYETTFQANTAAIERLQGELRDAKAELAKAAEAKPSRNGRVKTTAPAS